VHFGRHFIFISTTPYQGCQIKLQVFLGRFSLSTQQPVAPTPPVASIPGNRDLSSNAADPMKRKDIEFDNSVVPSRVRFTAGIGANPLNTKTTPAVRLFG
jgi:hypothetical protein